MRIRPNKLLATKVALFGGLLAYFSAAAAPTTSINYVFDDPGVAYDVSGALIFTGSGTGLSSAGTGTFGGYLTVGANKSVLEGISSDANSAGLMPDVTASQTSAIQLGTLQANAGLLVDGAEFLGFYLDLNEPDQHLSIDSLGIYYGTPANHPLTSALALGSLTKVWSMDTQGDTTLLVNEGLTAGSGKPNLAIAIPRSFFESLNSAGFIFLHFKAGEAGSWNGHNYGNAGGFEEFGLIQGGQSVSVQSLPTISPVPEAKALPIMLGVAGLAGLVQWRRVRR